MNYKLRYKLVCKCWHSYPNNLPIFEDDFFIKHFCKNKVMNIELAECCREQLIAIREGLAD